MAKGTIKSIISDKGFGFITPEGARQGEKDLFFHRSALTGGLRFESLKLSETVEFEIENGPKGPNAVNVRPLSEEGQEQDSENNEESESDDFAE